MDRYLIDAYGPDSQAEHDGLTWLAKRTHSSGLTGAVLVPDVTAILGLERVLGPGSAAAAQRDRNFAFDGARLEVLTYRTRPGSFKGPMLVLWANDSMVGEAEELRPAAICAIPWAEDDLVVWRRAWDPIDPRSGVAQGETAAANLGPLVEQALLSLTASCNLATGIGHPSDRRQATRTLKALHLAGERLESDEIEAWALRHGWAPRHTAKLAELTAKIAAGRAVRGAAMGKREAAEIVERLRAAAKPG